MTKQIERRARTDAVMAAPTQGAEALESDLGVRRVAKSFTTSTEPPALRRRLKLVEKLRVAQAVARADGLGPYERLLLQEIVDRSVQWRTSSYKTTQAEVAGHLGFSVRQVKRTQIALRARGLIGFKPTKTGIVYWPDLRGMERELRYGKVGFDLPAGAQEYRT